MSSEPTGSPEPIWVPRLAIELLHHDQLLEHGGLAGLRDENLLEVAVARPRSLWNFGEVTDLAALAAALGYGLTRGHAFVDGNKRIGFVAMAVFLDLNGRELSAEEPDVIATMRGVAAGDMSEATLANWIAQHLEEHQSP